MRLSDELEGWHKRGAFRLVMFLVWCKEISRFMVPAGDHTQDTYQRKALESSTG